MSRRLLLGLVLAVALGSTPASAAGLQKARPKLWSVAHADSLMARFPDPDSIPHRAWCYNQGYVLAGFEMLWESTGDPRYLAYLKQFVDQHVNAAGEIRGFRGNSLDDIHAGTAIVAVYRRTGEQRYKLAADRVRAAFNDYPRNSDGGLYHSRSPAMAHEMWIDGVFMGGLFLVRYGQFVGDREYCLNEAANQILVYASHGRKGDTGLFLHGYDEDKNAAWADPTTGLSSEVWSEGLGWYALVTVEAAKALPLDHPKRGEVVKVVQELAEGLRKTQDAETGLWHQVVDKGQLPDNWHETSGSGMFLYMIQRAIDLGYVSREQFAPVVKKGYAGLTARTEVDSYGLVNIYDACDGLGVQKSYADYVNYPRRINAKETLGSFLWAATVIEKPARAFARTAPLAPAAFKGQDIGNPQPAGSTTLVRAGLNLVAGGKDIWGAADQFHYAAQQRTGDFDVIVRLEALSAPDLYTKAGWMAREDLSAGSRHVFFQVFSDNQARHNNNGGYELQYRERTSGPSGATYPPEKAGAPPEFPVGYPNTWLRLRRSGSEFIGFSSPDGVTWKVYGSRTLDLPQAVYLGLALTAHKSQSQATARFCDLAQVK